VRSHTGAHLIYCSWTPVAGALAFPVSLIVAFQPYAVAQANVRGQWHAADPDAINPNHVSTMHNGNVLIVAGCGIRPDNRNFVPFNQQHMVAGTQ
jgi:hypothetical protein